MRITWLFTICAVFVMMGCSDGTTSVDQDDSTSSDVPVVDLGDAVEPETPSAETPAAKAEESPAPEKSKAPTLEAPKNDVEAKDEGEPSEESESEEHEEPEGEGTRVEAKAGVGVKGQRLKKKNVSQMIAYPAATYFSARQRIAFLTLENAEKTYKALNGQLPQTHEEYMEKVVKANSVQLPKLPPGERYVFDPKKGKLMVEKPD